MSDLKKDEGCVTATRQKRNFVCIPTECKNLILAMSEAANNIFPIFKAQSTPRLDALQAMHGGLNFLKGFVIARVPK
jgi:hypothetical protein